MTQILDFTKLSMSYNDASKRLIILDYDGTLVPFRNYPQSVYPPSEAIDTVKELCADSKNHVVIVSGRSCEDLELFWGGTSVNLAAEHGGFYQEAGKEWRRLFGPKPEWIQRVRPSLNALAFQHEGSFVEENVYSIAWHYRAIEARLSERDKQQVISAVMDLPEYQNFLICDSDCVMELRSPGVNKGTFTVQWLRHDQYDFVMALGDGATDEDLFRVLPRGTYSIKIGKSLSTLANYQIDNQFEVLGFLNRVLAVNREFAHSPARAYRSGAMTGSQQRY
ncbi:MAG: trehalose-phosphatase [Cyclobacteriaceae bacterium]|nr:trehalose-phosphatase [Cyclobacteriaceae bacterium]